MSGSKAEEPPPGPTGTAAGSVLRLILGRSLANREAAEEKIGVAAALAAMGLDGLSSAAYGPEAALTILLPLGALGLAFIGPIMLVILGLLAILYFSYCQTIQAYPVNGGSYTVAKENLGINAGLLAATALMIDYTLNVAVGISAGIGALVSAVPSLQPDTLWLCLAVLAVITVMNLRGTQESGLIFAVPTYLFIATLLLVIAVGVVRTTLGGGHAAPVVAPPPLPKATEVAGLWILMRAFASGCTAMTGVEAVSNSVDAFRKPTAIHAQRTLTAIVVILSLMLGGIAYLAHAYGIGAMDQTKPGYQSALSQLVAAVMGRGVYYYVTIAAILAVLCLSANTSFVGFPRLCRIVAHDDFLPRDFAMVGRRLVYSVGILYLAVTAGVLLVALGGITDRLIPLFAVGAFLAFTLSQAGMAMHWHRALGDGRKKKGRHAIRLRGAINGVGAIATGFALVVILAAKFVAGAWITVLVIPCVFMLLKLIKRQYEREERELHKSGVLALDDSKPPVVLIPMTGWNRLTNKAIGLALRLSPDVVAVHLTALEGPDVDEHLAALRRQWRHDVEQPAKKAGLNPPRLKLIHSPYRAFVAPCVAYIDEIKSEFPDRTVAILIPQIVKQHWWQHVLHGRHRANRLRAAMMQHGGPRVVVIDVPYYLEDLPDPAAAPTRQDRRARHAR